MRLLRWKNGYRSGNVQQDRENQLLAGCLNDFVTSAQTRDHCLELEELLAKMVQKVDAELRQGQQRQHIQAWLRLAINNSLPLKTYNTQACHHCGVCKLTASQPPAHLLAPARCMHLQKTLTQ